ncbi:outer mitochondrial membrane transport complex protein-domain-containing protein [Hypoxylon trugodes]|uniref:outer mitochondrial membrane transport complex protein-domain-containing protein n=1 Tax=Hypoxylon trugodes TaxID=326681 RepID=UPI002197CB71|nr:outer mitochondrial membrane transport complex protein-domain-containing protein [Hypoxylon trugodes]KAI1392928.1 outer mitochondrial membrane transport complex protein-domain-containing protein [Hypoxylon trugodes]
MALELHVWGPAFGLDSIDPECLAAVTCFRNHVPREHWTLIASNDAAVSPDHRLPALNHRGTWTSGYTEIISYLTKQKYLHIDDDLTPLQKADSLACASFLATRGSGLLAMSLYVSPRAWAEITRPAYSSLLPFPLTWTVPPAIRTGAIEKVEHLGIGHLAAEVDAEESPSTLAETTSTGFLKLRDRLGPSKAMQPEHTAAIRFQHFAEDFYSVLDQLRGEKSFFLRDDDDDSGPSSIDFLVYGYLQLMRVQTPHPILKTVLEKSFARLVAFLHSKELSTRSYELPWRQPTPRGALGLIGRFAEGSIEATPGVGDSWRKWRKGGVISTYSNGTTDDVRDPTQLILAAGTLVAGVAALGATVLFRALSPFGAATHRFEPTRAKNSGFNQFGGIRYGRY